eukprot:gene444-797_t
MQNAWLRELELVWSLKKKEEKKKLQSLTPAQSTIEKRKVSKKKKSKKKMGITSDSFDNNPIINDEQNDYEGLTFDDKDGQVFSNISRLPPQSKNWDNDNRSRSSNQISFPKDADDESYSKSLSNISLSSLPRKGIPTGKFEDGIEFRRCGVGSPGGHIARQLENPPQPYGQSIQKETIKPYNYDIKDKTFYDFGVRKVSEKPDWDGRFISEKSLLNENSNTQDGSQLNNNLQQDQRNMRQEVEQLTHKEGGGWKTPMSSKNSPTVAMPVQLVSAPTGNGLDYLAPSISSSRSQSYNQSQNQQHSPKKPSDDLISEAERLWSKMIQELRESGNAIQYSELVEIATLAKPPGMVQSVVFYVGMLLGIKTDWESVRRTLFRQLYPLLKFLKEVDPASIPHRRLKKALKLKQREIGNLSVASMESVHRAASKLMRWVLAFNTIAKLILSAEKRRKALNKSDPNNNDTDDPQFLDTDSLSQTSDTDLDGREGFHTAGNGGGVDEEERDLFPHGGGGGGELSSSAKYPHDVHSSHRPGGRDGNGRPSSNPSSSPSMCNDSMYDNQTGNQLRSPSGHVQIKIRHDLYPYKDMIIDGEDLDAVSPREGVLRISGSHLAFRHSTVVIVEPTPAEQDNTSDSAKFYDSAVFLRNISAESRIDGSISQSQKQLYRATQGMI